MKRTDRQMYRREYAQECYTYLAIVTSSALAVHWFKYVPIILTSKLELTLP